MTTTGATRTSSTTAAGGRIRSARPPGRAGRSRRRGAGRPAILVVDMRGRWLGGLDLFPRLLHLRLVGLPGLQVDVLRAERVGVADVQLLGERLVLDLGRR